MTVPQLLADLQSKNIHLWVDGDKLHYRAPQGALSEELRSQLARHKPEIISFFHEGARNAAPIPMVEREGHLPLSSAEEGLWLLEQINPGLSAWNMPSGLRLRGPLDAGAFQKSLDYLIARHEILRTSFRIIDGRATRVIAPTLAVDLAVIALSPSEETGAETDRIAAADQNTPFDLASAPLWRVKLLRMSDYEHVFLFTIHHIISDSSSNRIFYRELFEAYQAFAGGNAPALKHLPVQYADYALWQRRSERDATASHLAYWKDKLDRFNISEIPSDKRRPEHRTYHGAKQRVTLGGPLTQAMREICREERATMFMLVVAVFKLLLCRYTGNTDIIVGAATAGRNRPEVENLLGMFINILPLRTDLSGEPTFRELLRRVRDVCLEAYQRENLRFEKLVEELNPGRGLSRNPFFQVLFDVVNLPPNRREAARLSLEPMPHPKEIARYEIVVRTPQIGAGMEIWIDYCVDLFSQARIAEILEQYKYLLEQVVERPDDAIDQYSLWTRTARSLLPDPASPLERDWQGAVHELFSRRSVAQPEKVAVADGSESWTYGELDQRANQLAWRLREHGIGREDVVALYGRADASLVWALMGVFKAGAAFFMLDPSHPPARLKDYLDAVRPKGLITLRAGKEQLREVDQYLENFVGGCRIDLPSLASARENGFLSTYSTDDPKIAVGPEDLASIIFTSGSTGKPKGVLGRHSALTHFLPWVAQTFALTRDDRFSALAGLSSNILQREVFTALSLGATLFFPRENAVGGTVKLDAWMRDNGITIVHLTPAMAQVLDQTAQQPIPSVRRVFFAGDLLTLRDVEKTQRWMPAAQIVNFYASSESQRASAYKIFAGETDNEAKEIPPLGRGVKDVQLLVVNGHGHLAGVGELGEIWVRSPHLARGYLHDENLTRERFVVNPFTGHADDSVFRTGERGRFLPTGEVEFGGRLENQVSIRGFRVELSEIESSLGRHPGLREAVVMAREAPHEDTRLAAYVVPKQEPAPTSNELRAFLKQRLPEYMVPSAFVLMTNLPLTPNGKIDRAALPAVSQNRPELQNHYVAPRSRAEKMLAEIWADILNLERVGVHDNFFELGGHSILAVRLASEVERRFLKNVPAAMPFQAPTIAHMAKALFQARGPAPSPLMAIQTIGTKPPFFCVHGAEAYVPLARQLGTDQPFYGLSQHLDGRKNRSTRIEEIAANYINEMKKIQASGPYFLGGHSIGGMIAFEMAQQLRRQGAEVALLALFDAAHPDAFRQSPMDSGKDKGLYQRLFEVAKSRQVFQTVPARITQEAKAIACRTYQLLGMPLPIPLQDFYLDEMMYRRLYDKALTRYRPGSYQGRVALFLPTQKPDRWNRWQAAVGERANVHWLPGDRIDFSSETNIKMLANQLKLYLNKTRETSEYS